MSGNLTERREFPSKYNALPAISGLDNQNATPRDVTPRAPPLDYPSGMERSEVEDLFRQMESRVVLSERRNQGFLEEAARTRNELYSQIRRAEVGLQNEQTARQMIENSLQVSRDVIVQLATRLQRAEEKRQEDHGFVSGIAIQLKNLEQQSSLARKDSSTRREFQAARMEEMLTRLHETVRSKDQLERTVFEISSELQQMHAKVDAQSMDLVMTAKELKNKSQKLEEESKFAVENIRKTSEVQSYAEQSSIQLRSLIEQRLVEVRDAILDLRQKQDFQQKEQRASDHRLSSRISELQIYQGEQNRKRDEALLAMELAQRDRNHALEQMIGKLHARMVEVAEELSSKLLQKEMKIREENQARCSQVETALGHEIEAREKAQRMLKDEMEHMMETMMRPLYEERQQWNENQAMEKKKSNEAFVKLNEAVNLVEQHFEEYKRQHDRLFAAEIEARKLTERTLTEKVTDIHEKLVTSLRYLQDTMSDIGNKAQAKDNLMEDLRQTLEAQKRKIVDLERRVEALKPAEDTHNQFVEGLRQELEKEKKQRNQDVDELRKQMLTTDKESTAQQIRKLQDKISALSVALESVKSTLGTKLHMEEKKRSREVELLRDEIQQRLRAAADDDAQPRQEDPDATAADRPEGRAPRGATRSGGDAS